MPFTPQGLTDEALCAAITRKHARTFTAASRFLPREKRRAAFAVYAFCRVADDYVDEAHNGGVEAERNLDSHLAAFHAALDGRPASPLFRELLWAINRFEIPTDPFDALIRMLREDLAPVAYEDWAQLECYCSGVASTVGEMCAFVFGMPAAPVARLEALRCARTLGVALQLTNILRDVGEDAGRGRCYLPASDLKEFGLTRDGILGRTILASDFRWQAFMKYQIARSRTLYNLAEPGLRMLDRDAQCCATICSTGYAGILGAIERRNYDSLGGRAHLGAARKAAVMLNAWRSTRRVWEVRADVVRHSTSDRALGTGG